MKRLLVIAGAEWRYWMRSRPALGGAVLMAVLLVATTLLTTLRMQGEAAERAHHQAEAETAFLSQPDRHPHRMVHYGHYVFRTPAPLALFDPGLDPVTGQSIFLEGHRQNTAMFAAAGASADLGGFSWLSPAMVYQLFGPLLVILLGHGLVAREREAATLATLLAQGTPGRVLLAGKALALLSVVGVLLLPLALSAGLVVYFSGHLDESPLTAAALVGAYLLYLAIWGAMALLASALLKRRSAVLATLATLWIALPLVLPAAAVSVASNAVPMAGKLETDLAMLTDLRKLGDGHNANDPAFAQLRADLLAKYRVQRVEDLPFNLRGVVAQVGEQRLTDTLNTYARAQMAAERRQAAVLAGHGWLTPLLAVAEASRAVSGTDLAHHHRFLQEAEALRYAFVQGLNRLHAEKLAYSDDVRRSGDAQAEERTRVDATNWQLLGRFVFQPSAWKHRVRMLALEGQIHERDAGHPVLALIGRFDFAFLVAFVLPLVLIVLLHDLRASERVAGRHDLLVATAGQATGVWHLRAALRASGVFVCAAVPLLVAGSLAGTAVSTLLAASALLLVYLLFWTAVCASLATWRQTGEVILAALVALWILLGVITPAAGRMGIDRAVPVPSGADIIMTQREAVNDAWDLPKATTMTAFVEHHPQWTADTAVVRPFEWKWYYAFQQVGDQKAHALSAAYTAGRRERDRLAGWLAFIAPPVRLERSLQALARTDVRVSLAYEARVRGFHAALRAFYYPRLFRGEVFDPAALEALPGFAARAAQD